MGIISGNTKLDLAQRQAAYAFPAADELVALLLWAFHYALGRPDSDNGRRTIAGTLPKNFSLYSSGVVERWSEEKLRGESILSTKEEYPLGGRLFARREIVGLYVFFV